MQQLSAEEIKHRRLDGLLHESIKREIAERQKEIEGQSPSHTSPLHHPRLLWLICTIHVERQNRTIRTLTCRFTRLSLAEQCASRRSSSNCADHVRRDLPADAVSRLAAFAIAGIAATRRNGLEGDCGWSSSIACSRQPTAFALCTSRQSRPTTKAGAEVPDRSVFVVDERFELHTASLA